MPLSGSVGRMLRQMRERPRPGAPRGLSVAEAARRTGMWGQDPLSESFWAQVERGGSKASESSLLRMALAVDAGPEELGALFRAAGFGHLFDTLISVGTARRNVASVYGAEAGILSDPRLTYEKRNSLLDHLRDVLDALEARQRQVASPDPPDETDGDKDGNGS